MGESTKISWTDKTWNPFQGCHKLTVGCKNCYMFREKARYGQDPNKVIRSKPRTFNAPLRWEKEAVSSNKRVLIFTCSWSDWFIEEADAWRDEAWNIIKTTPHLTYQILTKRPERLLEHLPQDWGTGYSNVWLGVTVEDQKRADERIPHLAKIPAAVKFLSCEPLLERVNLSKWLDEDETGFVSVIDLVIIGGESGPKARPFNLDWARGLVRQCRDGGRAEALPFVKQMGSNPVETRRCDIPACNCGGTHTHSLHYEDSHGGEMAEWPIDLRVRELPPRL